MRSCTAGYSDRPVFDNLDLELWRQDVLAVVGASGVGKTTLLHVLAGLLPPMGGEVRFGGRTLRKPEPDIGIVFQDHSLFPWMTIGENVELGMRIRGIEAGERMRRTRRMLEDVGIGECAPSYPHAVSGGQRQRAALARTLVLDPAVVLLDEPFSSLDALTRERLQELTLSRLTARLTSGRHGEAGAADKPAAVLVTHDTEEAVYLGTRLSVLRPGDGGLSYVENPARGMDRTSALFVSTRKALRRLLGETIDASLT